MQNMRVLNFVTKMMRDIETNLDHPINMDRYLSQFDQTEEYLRQQFFRLVAETPEDYLARLRLESALHILTCDPGTDSGFLEQLGFDSYAQFSTLFEEHFDSAIEDYLPQVHKNYGYFYDMLYHSNPAEVSSGPMENPFVEHELYEQNQKMTHAEGLADLIEIDTIKPFQVFYSRHIGHYWQVYKAWIKMFMVPKIGMKLLGKGFIRIGVVHDYPWVTPIGALRYDACVRKADFRLSDKFPSQKIGGGKFLICYGVDLKSVDLFRQLMLTQWMPKNGCRFRPAATISYIKLSENIVSTQQVSKVVCDLAIPIY